MKFDRPNIMICGPSGSGKSTSLRNLETDRTIIINTEMKTLPFRSARKFKNNRKTASYKQFKKTFDLALKHEKSDIIVIDSFTSLTEFVYNAFVRHVEKSGDGSFSAWSTYKDVIRDILVRAKRSDKFVIFTGIDSVEKDENMRLIREVAVQGSLQGMIEKEFEICLWTKIINNIEDNETRYVFATNGDGANKAKTPMDMFSEQYIDNDLNAVLQAIDAYYTEETA